MEAPSLAEKEQRERETERENKWHGVRWGLN